MWMLRPTQKQFVLFRLVALDRTSMPALIPTPEYQMTTPDIHTYKDITTDSGIPPITKVTTSRMRRHLTTSTRPCTKKS